MATELNETNVSNDEQMVDKIEVMDVIVDKKNKDEVVTATTRNNEEEGVDSKKELSNDDNIKDDTDRKKKKKKKKSRTKSRSRSRDNRQRRHKRSSSRDRGGSSYRSSRSSRHRSSNRRRSRSRSKDRGNIRGSNSSSSSSSNNRDKKVKSKNTLMDIIKGANKIIDQTKMISGAYGGGGDALTQGANLRNMLARLKATDGTSLYTNPNDDMHVVIAEPVAVQKEPLNMSRVIQMIPLPPPPHPSLPPTTFILIEQIPGVVDEALLHSLTDPFGPCTIVEFDTSDTERDLKRAIVKFNNVPTAWMAMKGLVFFSFNGLSLITRMVPLSEAPATVLELIASTTAAPSNYSHDVTTESTDVNATTTPAPLQTNQCAESVVIRLSNMVTSEELQNDADYAEIKEDVAYECGNYGSVVSVVIPRPVGENTGDGVGYIFVQYQTEAEAEAAASVLQTRVFDGRAVEVTFFSLEKFKSGIYV